MTQVWSASHINANLSGGGTTTVTNGATNHSVNAFGSEGFTTGKYYWETDNSLSTGGNDSPGGIGNIASSTSDDQWIGIGYDTLGLYSGGGVNIQLWINGSAQATYTQANADGDRWAHALDLTNNLYWCKDITQNSAWFGSTNTGDPASGTGGFSLTQTNFTIINNPVVPAATLYTNGSVSHGYFAQSSWSGPAPTGFGPFDQALSLMGQACL